MALTDIFNRAIETEKDEIGIAGFTLFARVRDVTDLKSSAPNSFVEDGSFINDHIINEPLTISIEGSVGDVFIRKTPIEAAVNRVNQAIGATEIFLPQRTLSQIQRVNDIVSDARDKVRQIDNAIAAGKNLLKFGGQSTTKSDQEKFVDAMEALHYGKQLVSIDMPYRRHESMRITSTSITRDSTSAALSFKITAQKVRIAQPVYKLNAQLTKAPSAAIADQTGGQQDKGAQAGAEPSQSLLSYIRSFF